MADEIRNNTENTEPEDNKEMAAEAAEEAAEKAEESNNDKKEAEKESKLVDDIIEIVESTLLTVFVIVMIFTYLLHPVNVPGSSMTNTLFEGNRIFMTTVYSGPHYGDIIVINNDMSYLLDEEGKVYEKDITGSPLKECIIKRVIAEPGQTLMIDAEKEQVIVDGVVLDEPYIKETVNNTFGAFDFPIVIPDGYYFVMGDNRRGSSDSRDPNVGLIKKDQIYGKAVLRYSPIKELKFLL